MGIHHAGSSWPSSYFQGFGGVNEARKFINDCPSSPIFTRNHHRTIIIAKELKIAAIHINCATVHDEPAIPYGEHGDRGWGRFGGSCGFGEFIHTKTIILNE